MDKVLSVSVAAYNVEMTLHEALEPFCNCRNMDKLDVMIINDGSTDMTAQIAREYEERYPKVFRLISKENGGWGSTLNVGINEARGKYFKQLDGDDYFSEENLDDYIDFLEECNADIVYTPFITFEDSSRGILKELGLYPFYILPERKILKLSEISNFVPSMHTLTVFTEMLKTSKICITEKCFYTDVEFVLKCCNCGSSLIAYELPIYYYRLARNGQSMSLAGVRKHYRDHLKMLTIMLEYEKLYVTSDSIKKMFHERLLNACNMQYMFFFALERNKVHKNELISYDNMLKKDYPFYYFQLNRGIKKIMRKYHFNMYILLTYLADREYKKNKMGVYEGV
jgi:glycosyltransferase involved in cell wall biosynthesis